MKTTYNFMDWFILFWSRTALPIAVVLLIFSPFFISALGGLVFLVFLQLPVYMFHQYEEHAQGKFRVFINAMLADGRDIITDRDIFLINIIGVWMVNALSVYLAYYVSPILGLISPYISLVNAVLHIAPAIMQRRYNPGLWTSIFLFMPLGIYTVSMFSSAAQVQPVMHILFLGAAVLLHVITFAYMRRNLSIRTT